MTASGTGTIRGAPRKQASSPYRSNNSGIPRPSSEQSTPQSLHDIPNPSPLSASRQKQSKRDEAIRRRIEADLSKKRSNVTRMRHSRKVPPGTVLALRPSPALQIKPNTSVAEAAQLMAAKREDCVLVTDDDDRIAGIFTAKDLAFRVVGAGINARDVTIADIMTRNPLCAKTDTSATDALDLMVRKGFRHLPVMDENHDISGILDITKCFYDAMEKLERAYSSSRKLHNALEGVQAELGSCQPLQVIQYVEALRKKMSGPTLESVLTGLPPTTVSVRTTVREAASLMRERHTTAVLVQDQGSITGIFTSKDVVLRVIAAGIDPGNCSVVRVMTPHPDFASIDMTIQAALRKMHDGHYLNLPVTSLTGEIVGIVDVLKLTYATLDQINSMQNVDNEGPAWNKFWLSFDNDTDSVVSASADNSRVHGADSRSLTSPDINRLDFNDQIMPHESASLREVDSPEHSIVAGILSSGHDIPFPFKFKSPGGRVHRVQVTGSAGISALVSQVIQKLGDDVDKLDGSPIVNDGQLSSHGFALSYMDNEGDIISMTSDNDLIEAVILARQNKRDKVNLFVHHPQKPPCPDTLGQEGKGGLDPIISSNMNESEGVMISYEGMKDGSTCSSTLRQPSTISRKSKISRHATVRARPRPVTADSQTSDIDPTNTPSKSPLCGKSNRKDSTTSTGDHASPFVSIRTGGLTSQSHQHQYIPGIPNDLLLPGSIVTLAAVILGVFTFSRLTAR